MVSKWVKSFSVNPAKLSLRTRPRFALFLLATASTSIAVCPTRFKAPSDCIHQPGLKFSHGRLLRVHGSFGSEKLGADPPRDGDAGRLQNGRGRSPIFIIVPD